MVARVVLHRHIYGQLRPELSQGNDPRKSPGRAEEGARSGLEGFAVSSGCSPPRSTHRVDTELIGVGRVERGGQEGALRPIETSAAGVCSAELMMQGADFRRRYAPTPGSDSIGMWGNHKRDRTTVGRIGVISMPGAGTGEVSRLPIGPIGAKGLNIGSREYEHGRSCQEQDRVCFHWVYQWKGITASEASTGLRM